MKKIEFKDLNEVVAHFAKKLSNTKSITSTNEKNKKKYKNKLAGELTQQFFIIKDSTKVLCTYENHKYYKWWLYGEILSEMLNLDPPIMYKYKPELYSQHYDLLEDGRMQYTYGSRFMEYNQLVNIYKKLKKNLNSKRCVITIYTPYDTAPDRADSPCTTMYHFICRNGKLNMSVFYRSWDFFGGFKTYDFGLSSFILQSLCSWLKLKPGQLAFYVNSLHYYNRDEDKMQKLVKEVKKKKSSDKLVLGENIEIGEFYERLRNIKLCEELSYALNYRAAKMNAVVEKNDLFFHMCKAWIDKNGLKG